MIRLFAAVLLFVSIGCNARAPEKEVEVEVERVGYWDKTKDVLRRTREQGGDLLTPSTNETWKTVRALYDRAREAGDDVPSNVVEWARQDVRQIGKWDYKILEITSEDPVEIEARLREAGVDRWECYWVEVTPAGKRFYLKKAGRSYLRTIPLGDLLKLVPDGGS